MINLIQRDGETIFSCVNWEMDLIYNYLSYVIKNEKLHANKNICDFLNSLNQNIIGRGNVFVDVYSFFGPSEDKTPLKVLFELIEKMIQEIEKSNCQEAEFIESLKKFQQKILLPKTKRLPIVTNAIMENSIEDISDDFREFIYSLSAANYIAYATITKFKHDSNKNLTVNDIACIFDSHHICERPIYESTDATELSPLLFEVPFHEAYNDINDIFAYGDNFDKNIDDINIDKRKKTFWNLIGRHTSEPIKIAYKLDIESDSIYYSINYFLLTSNEGVLFQIDAYD